MVERSTLAIAVDVGGTGTRLRVGDAPDGLELPGACITATGLDMRALVDAVRTAISTIDHHDETRIAVAVGSTGLPELVADPAAVLNDLRSLGVHRIVLAADAVTAHIGALGLEPGVVVAAGTGVVALGTDLDAEWHRVDGWGHLLGDDGGGAWIGMHGLRAALRSIDGRPDGSPMLERLAAARFGNPDVLVRELYTRADRAASMASFVPDVLAAAHADDQVAESIFRAAGIHLADAAVAAVNRSGQRTVAYTGRLFHAGDLLLAPMRERLAAADLKLTAPLGTPLDGATTLARLAADHPDRVPRPHHHHHHHHQHHLITMIGDAA